MFKGYNSLHQWLYRHYGKASKCEQCGSEFQVQWALIKGKEYKRDRNNFFQLCCKCHLIYDNTAIKPGQRLSPNTEIKKGKHKSLNTEFKLGCHINKGKRNSPKTEFKKGHISVNKGKILINGHYEKRTVKTEPVGGAVTKTIVNPVSV